MARRHRIKLVRFLKYFFVFFALVTVASILYYVVINQNSKISHKSAPKIQKVEKGNEISFQAKAPELTGVSLDHGPYYIRALEMQELSGQVSFIDPKVKLMLNHLDWGHLTARKANLTTADNHLQLFDNIKGDLNSHYFFKGNQVEVFEQESIIQSDNLSTFYTSEYNLESKDGFIIDYRDQTAFFHGAINANMKREKDKSVTNIKSDKLDVFWQRKMGHFIGNVVLTKEGTIVKSDKMTAIINAKTEQLEKIYAYGNVKIINEEETATSEFGEYTVSTAILTLKDNVKLIKQGNIATGELLHYNFNTRKADLVGDSSNKRVKAVITSHKKKQ